MEYGRGVSNASALLCWLFRRLSWLSSAGSPARDLSRMAFGALPRFGAGRLNSIFGPCPEVPAYCMNPCNMLHMACMATACGGTGKGDADDEDGMPDVKASCKACC